MDQAAAAEGDGMTLDAIAQSPPMAAPKEKPHDGRRAQGKTIFEHDSTMKNQGRMMADPFDAAPSATPASGANVADYTQWQADEQHPAGGPAHVLEQFVEYDLTNLRPKEFIFDGVMVAGLVLVAGSVGVGKTTQLVPLMCRAAHLCRGDDPLRPTLRRNVIYISEDVNQVEHILASMHASGEFAGFTMAEVRERFKIVEAKRLSADVIVRVKDAYLKLSVDNTCEQTGVTYVAKPVVVFDTASATIHLDNENDNSEVSSSVSTVKQEFGGIPAIIVAHIAKTLKRSDVADFSARGASAWEGDVNQVMYLTFEDKCDQGRWLEVKQAKHRFAAIADGISFGLSTNNVSSKDILGRPCSTRLVHATPSIVSIGERDAMKAEARRKADREAEMELEDKAVTTLVDAIRHNGYEYLTKTELKKEVGGKGDLAGKAIDAAIKSGRIVSTSHKVAGIEPRAKQHMQILVLPKDTSHAYDIASNG